MKTCLLLLIAAAAPLVSAPAKIVMVAGKPSHAPGEHEFNAGTLLLEKCLRQNKGVETVVVKDGWPTDENLFEGASAIVLYMDGGARHPLIEGTRLDTIGKLIRKGVGLVCLHYAVEVPKEKGGPELLDWIGGYYERPYSQNPINEAAVTQGTPKHPISRGWKSFAGRDEWYYRIRFRPDDKRVIPILTAMLPKEAPNKETIAWAVERADGGRGFGFTGAHFHSNWGIPEFRRMIVNAILWSAKLPVPESGAKCDITSEDLRANQDPKPPRKKQ
ncbi:MAG TPA: ThuA domain-containing protein [Bryobacteraceae bacterium]|jgi:type 1 glutamine amidotransferase|nr:ThuA domain-containing protein [Bryobacteraceae bacterium]